MDSLTQVALGGAVGYAVLGKQLGPKAALWGAAFGTLPDLDVFLPYGGEVEAFTYHRSFSHSFIVHLMVAPFFAWLLAKLHKRHNTELYVAEHGDTTQTPRIFGRFSRYEVKWFYLVFLCLSTHALLDSCTVYGTQLFWPLTEYPVGISNLFIIDPLYTLPLLIGFVFALIPRLRYSLVKKANAIGLILSSVYVLWSLGAKVYIDQKVEEALAIKGIQAEQFISTPAPFTTFLWRVVVMVEPSARASDAIGSMSAAKSEHYFEAYASILDTPEQISFDAYQTDSSLIADIESEWGVNRLKWFTKGFYAIKNEEDKVILSDLRMGVECSYVFNFTVGVKENDAIQLGDFEQVANRPDFSKMQYIWARIFDPNVSLAPHPPQGQCADPTQAN
ncbi:metal-dependent hydrolase [Ningiella sp. W23]|uniref:metal-dependent hydrolase n=1 Tax=Ningiella sp. W23 TaxID=3023715 RepID=UPI00375662E4